MSDQIPRLSDHGPDEQALRAALLTEAELVGPTPDWSDVRRRADRFRGRGVVLAVAAAVIVGVVAIIVPPVLRDTPEQVLVAPPASEPSAPAPELPVQPPVPTPPAAPPVATPIPEPTQSPTVWPALNLPAGEPLADDEIVAILQRSATDELLNDVVVLDAGGAVIRTLAANISTSEGGVYELSLSPDGRTVMWGAGTSACTGVVEAVAADGSTAEPVRPFAGNGAVMSWDRSLLALDPRDFCEPPNQIELIPAGGGPGRLFGDGGTPLNGLSPGPGGGVDSMAFVGTETLLYSVVEDGGLWALDLTSGADRRVDPVGDSGQYHWLHTLDHERVITVHEGVGGWEIVIINDDQVFSREPTPDGAPTWQASISDQLGTVATRGSGVQALVVGGRQVRTDVGWAIVGSGLELPDAGPLPAEPSLSPAQEDAARRAVEAFLDAFATEDLAAAARYWTGYPDVDGSVPGAVETELREGRPLADWPALADVPPDPQVFVSPAWAFEEPGFAVVTHLYTRPGEAPSALAFLVDVSGNSGTSAIVRLPPWVGEAGPDEDGVVSPGDTVVVPGTPIEGGAVAHVGDVEVLVTVDHERQVTLIVLPVDISGDIALTLSGTTPELPTAEAYAFTVRE